MLTGEIVEATESSQNGLLWYLAQRRRDAEHDKEGTTDCTDYTESSPQRTRRKAPIRGWGLGCWSGGVMGWSSSNEREKMPRWTDTDNEMAWGDENGNS